MVETHPPENQFHIAAAKCIANCEGLLEEMHPFYANALRIYSRVNDQVLVAGMGEIIGLNHLALHRYLEIEGYSGLEYQLLFNEVIDIHRKIHSKQTAKTQPVRTPAPPAPPTPRTISTRPTPRPLRPQQN